MEGCEVAANKIFRLGAASLNENQAAFIASLFPLPFPKSVWVAYSSHSRYPFSEPSEIIGFAKDVAPRWSERVQYRFSIAQDAYERMPKSL